MVLASFFSLSTFATPILLKSQKILSANVYADQLLYEFDRELELRLILNQRGSILLSETYFKLLAAREYIEEMGGEGTEYFEKTILFINNPKTHVEVVGKINEMSKTIKDHRLEADAIVSGPILYPSLGGTGNVTGNTFPDNVWSLTFDDGPHATRTDAVIENLYDHHLKASFFVLMSQANKYPEVIKNIVNSDMELALHSYNHLNLVKEDAATIDYEITQSKKELEDQSGVQVKLFRLPYGSGTRNAALREKLVENKLIHIFWNVDTLDWKDKDPESILARAKKQMELTPNKSGIILFHDIHRQSVLASEMLMQHMRDTSKKVCTVGEVIHYINGTPQSCL